MAERDFWTLVQEKVKARSHAETAQKCDVPLDTYRGYVQGRHLPSPESATKVSQAIGMSPVGVLVGAVVHSAQKSVERGEDAKAILARAEQFVDLASQADDQRDAKLLTEGSRELLKMARSAAKTEFEEADPNPRDAFGYSKRKQVKSWRAMLTEHRDEDVDADTRDPISGRQTRKIVRSQREGLRLQR